ncbi:acylphosphatase [Chitinophaga pendula]|uniref:acylphosphatase n=1 Tax=Chitinophaga TaxID=79328 RepID=UPI000BB0343B|nr:MULTISPECIES: acylphosphatase [Chitinophaga]ASZ13957.1 acylphosphatase [Chitinophaga sp. MD30]UCJ08420.1 acylphosphatase [Chitinophaga pendula]
MSVVYKEIIVKGIVQGVYFRATTRDIARQLGVKGQVKNLPDGSVHIIATGDDNAIEQFIAWCRQGPPDANVEELQILPLPAQHFDTFEIVR